ncbi:hypothetical protein pb186bvf_016307 [Paramecium bursaria]
MSFECNIIERGSAISYTLKNNILKIYYQGLQQKDYNIAEFLKIQMDIHFNQKWFVIVSGIIDGSEISLPYYYDYQFEFRTRYHHVLMYLL